MWKTIESRPVVSSRYVNVLKNAIQLPNGETIDDYYTVTIPEASAIVAITEDGKLILKMEYRYACREDLIEIPAGGIEKGESPLQAAQRELLEETGYTSTDWTYLVPGRECTAKLTNTMHIFLARGCRKVAPQKLDPTEDVKVLLVPFQEAVDMILTGNIKCCSSVHGILMVQAMMKNN